MSTDFLKSIENAHRAPDTSRDDDSTIPNIFSHQRTKQLASKVIEGVDGQIPGVTQYDFTFHCARLIMGKTQIDFQNGQAIYEDKDDGERLKEIMDQSLAGKSVINKKETTFLKDGTVVLWIEWLERKEPEQEDNPFLTEEQLRSPERITGIDPDESVELGAAETDEDDEGDGLPDFSSAIKQEELADPEEPQKLQDPEEPDF